LRGDVLRAGAIDLNRYLDSKVEEATASVADLAPAQIERVRSALRERLSSDPTLVDLVRKATDAIEIPAPSIEACV
jgi:di/tripeptidase